MLLTTWLTYTTSEGAEYTPFEGAKTAWHGGFDRYDFVIDEETPAVEPFQARRERGFGVNAPPKGKRRCVVVVPKKAAPGHPWTWRGCYWDHEPQTEVELLRRGFHVAFITPDPDRTWDAWYTLSDREARAIQEARVHRHEQRRRQRV